MFAMMIVMMTVGEYSPGDGYSPEAVKVESPPTTSKDFARAAVLLSREDLSERETRKRLAQMIHSFCDSFFWVVPLSEKEEEGVVMQIIDGSASDNLLGRRSVANTFRTCRKLAGALSNHKQDGVTRKRNRMPDLELGLWAALAIEIEYLAEHSSEALNRLGVDDRPSDMTRDELRLMVSVGKKWLSTSDLINALAYGLTVELVLKANTFLIPTCRSGIQTPCRN